MKAKVLVLIISLLLLSAWHIGPAFIQGSIDAAAYKMVEPGTVFTISAHNDSLTERRIVANIFMAMTHAGYKFASKGQKPAIKVLYSYEVGPGAGMYSRPQYPRYFSMTIVEYSKANKKNVIAWQGEIRSNGSGNDMSRLSKPFAQELVRFINKATSGQSFMIPAGY